MLEPLLMAIFCQFMFIYGDKMTNLNSRNEMLSPACLLIQAMLPSIQTNITEHNASWKANSSYGSHEIPYRFFFFWNLRVHYRIHKSSPHLTILSQINPVRATASYFLNISFNP